VIAIQQPDPRMTRGDRANARKKRRAAIGLCPTCGQPSSPGSQLCDKHREKMRVHAEERYRLRRLQSTTDSFDQSCIMPQVRINAQHWIGLELEEPERSRYEKLHALKLAADPTKSIGFFDALASAGW
jgi:hypothetical protein